MGKIVGIDLGTTNSAVAVIEAGEPKVIANAEGVNTTPSIVAFPKNSNDVLVGELAKRQTVTNVDRTIVSVKRHMGESWTKNIDGKNYTPEEISARILQKLKKDAETYLGTEVTDAVITVPAYFSDAQRKATQQAGQIAGLKVLRIINEPTAAALAYGLEKAAADEKILVFDLGGGTFDVSLLEIGKDDDGFSTIEVLATSGDNNLGGNDWDNAVTQYVLADFKKTTGVDLSNDKIALQRIIEGAEQAKKELSASTKTSIQLPYISMSNEGPLNLDVSLSRAKFEEITKGLLDRTVKPFEQVLADAKLASGDIDHVVLVGGSTRMPAVAELVKKLSGKEANKGVNPDEVVAYGAALQASVLTGERKDVLLIDVTPLSLGIRTAADTMTTMIARNSAVPTQKSEIFTTASDNQAAVTIMVAQGERSVFTGNKLLGQFDLAVAPAPAGRPQIQVTFSLDANGVLDVSAKDMGTGKENKVTISGGNNLSEAEVEKMIRDAEAHAKEDALKTQQAELLNNAERSVHQAEQVLVEHSANISDELKGIIQSDIDSLKLNVENKNYDSLQSGIDSLSRNLQKVGEAIYGSNGSSDSSAPAGDSEPEDDVVEAEIVDDEK